MHTINPISEWMPAFRQPTPYEREQIAEKWRVQLHRRYRPNRGKVAVGLGIAGLVLLLLDVIVAPTALSDKLILTAGIVSCFSAGRRQRASAKRIENMFSDLDQGRFCVLPAVAESVRFNKGSHIYEGFVRVSLDGGRTYSEYRFPVEDARKKQCERAVHFSVLLIKLEGENEIVAISAP